MTDKIKTAYITDLIDIFSPDAQEEDDVGGARILYTFTDNKEPTRERVGDTFILEVVEPKITFFVTAPITDNILDGTITPARSLEGVSDRYRLAEQELKQLIFDVSTALDYDESKIAELLDE